MSWLIPAAILVLAAAAAVVVAIVLHRRVYVTATPLCLIAAGVIAYVGITGDADTSSPDPNPSAPFRIVALGDSYISGEGAPQFLTGTDRPGRNECRRASTAYPYLAARELDAALTFVACSGARTYDVTGVDASGATVPGQQPNSPGGIFGARPQISELEAVKDPGVVLLSIGGNDAGFAQIGVGCASPTQRDCRRSADAWIKRLDRDAATSHHMLPDGVAMKRSPTAICCHSGWMRSALRRPKLSRRSQLYQPARSTPICTSHGQTAEGGASIVVAVVALRVPPGMRSAPGYGRFTSSSVAPQRSSRGLTPNA